MRTRLRKMQSFRLLGSQFDYKPARQNQGLSHQWSGSMKRILSFVPALGFIFVLFVVTTTTSYPVGRLVIPTNVTGTQGDCLRLTEEGYRKSWSLLHDRQVAGTAEINEDREDTLLIVWLIENSIPGGKKVADWIMDIIIGEGFDAANDAVNAYYDNEIGILEGNLDNSRRILNGRTNASISHCRTLPLTHPPSSSSDGEEGLESDPTQMFNQQFNWGAWNGTGGNTPCGNYSSSHSIPKYC